MRSLAMDFNPNEQLVKIQVFLAFLQMARAVDCTLFPVSLGGNEHHMATRFAGPEAILKSKSTG